MLASVERAALAGFASVRDDQNYPSFSFNCTESVTHNMGDVGPRCNVSERSGSQMIPAGGTSPQAPAQSLIAVTLPLNSSGSSNK